MLFKRRRRNANKLRVALCAHDTSAGFELLRQNFADLVHPRRFNLWCWSLDETNNEGYTALTVIGLLWSKQRGWETLPGR